MPSPAAHDYDELFEAAGGDRIPAGDLEMAREVLANLRGEGKSGSLVEVLLRLDLISLRRANTILQSSPARILQCHTCKVCHLLEVRRFTGQLYCPECGADLNNLRPDLCLEIPKALTAAEEYGPSVLRRFDRGIRTTKRLQEGRYEGWYLAEKGAHKEPAVMMELPPTVQQDPEQLADLQAKFERARSFRCRARPPFFEIVHFQDRYWVLQTPLRGPSPVDLVAEHGPVPAAQVLRVMTPVADALRTAHRHEVCGFHLFPELVVADGYDRVMLLDLATGFLRREVVGQVAYRAPEALAGRGGDVRTDVYTFCAVCCYLLTGAPPHAGGTVEEVRGKVLAGGIPSLRERRPDLPEELASLLDAGLSPTLEDRPTDLAKLHRLMQEAKLYFRGQVERARALSAELLEASPPQPPGPPRGRITARTLQQRREAADAAENPARVDLAALRMQVREHVTAQRLDQAARVLREIVALAERVPGFTGEAEQARRLLRRIEDPGA